MRVAAPLVLLLAACGVDSTGPEEASSRGAATVTSDECMPRLVTVENPSTGRLEQIDQGWCAGGDPYGTVLEFCLQGRLASVDCVGFGRICGPAPTPSYEGIEYKDCIEAVGYP